MSSESDEDDFVTYGTPLDPLEEEAIPKKRALTVEDQVAKDKHGRRRFHGAFTGGFSAGFYNTVGSLEGWKPSQFKSSRSAKTQAQFQRPEDFMDDEDVDEFGIAPKMIRTTGDYNQSSGDSSRKRSLMQFSEGPIPGVPVLRTLIEPAKETIGIRLLMKMGWKPGQGIGPRLTRAEKSVSKKSQKQNKIYGCALPAQDEPPGEEADGESEEDEFDADVTFAPDDYEAYIVKPKDDSFGLGYSGLDRRPVLSSHVNLFGPATSSLVMQEKNKKVSIRGQAFGVGAFEKDDEDIYASEDMSQYDFALDTPKMLAEKRQQQRNNKSALPTSSAEVLEGFLVMSCPVVRKRYPPPPLPPGFTPHHETRQSRFSVATGSQGHVTRLTANERAVLVNDETNQLTLSQTEAQQTTPLEVERTTGTFRPFVADPEKQLRYEKFLTLTKLDQTEKLKSLQPLAMTEWEQERERAEFEQASRLYRPLSAAFSERFVSASQLDSATDPLEPVARSSTADEDLKSAAKMKMFGRLTRRISEWQPHSILCKRFNIPQPGGTSGSMKPRTSRPKFSVFNFLDAAPFNVPGTSSEHRASSEKEDEVMPQATPTPPPTTTPAVQESKMEVTAKDNDLDQLIDSTNKMDLFKAIFLSSSDESDGEEKPAPTAASMGSKQPTATELNVLRNSSPPRGIFANLDLDALNQEKKSVQDKSTTDVNAQRNTSPPRGIFANLDFDAFKKKDQTTIDKVAESSENNRQESEEPPSLNLEDSFVYGPSLPKSIPRQQTVKDLTKEDCSDSDEDWVEMNDSGDNGKVQSKKKHSKKSHKKSKKHKEKKHKHKKKRK